MNYNFIFRAKGDGKLVAGNIIIIVNGLKTTVD